MQIDLIPAFYSFIKTKKRYKFAFGGRGGGKSIQYGFILLREASFKKIKVVCTREVQKSIHESVHALLKEIIEKYSIPHFDIKRDYIAHKVTGSIFTFAGLKEHTMDSFKGYQGSDYCWVEEAHSITQPSMDILTPTIRKEGSEIWFSYNRKGINDPVHKLFKKETTKEQKKKVLYNDNYYYWHEYYGNDAIAIQINYDGNPFFPEVLRKEKNKDKEWDYELYLHKWEGHPELQSTYSLIKRADIIQAINRKVESWNYITFGVDPARYGDDESVLCIREGFKIKPFKTFSGINTTQLAGMILNKAKEYKQKGYTEKIKIRVDDTGIGAGVTDTLKEKQEFEDTKALEDREYNIEVVPVNFGGKSINSKYKNYGTCMWGNAKDSLKTMAIPDDEIFQEQLANRKYKIESDGTIKLESKDDMKKRGESSPDRADSFVLAIDEHDGGQPRFKEDEKLMFEQKAIFK